MVYRTDTPQVQSLYVYLELLNIFMRKLQPWKSKTAQVIKDLIIQNRFGIDVYALIQIC